MILLAFRDALLLYLAVTLLWIFIVLLFSNWFALPATLGAMVSALGIFVFSQGTVGDALRFYVAYGLNWLIGGAAVVVVDTLLWPFTTRKVFVERLAEVYAYLEQECRQAARWLGSGEPPPVIETGQEWAPFRRLRQMLAPELRRARDTSNPFARMILACRSLNLRLRFFHRAIAPAAPLLPVETRQQLASLLDRCAEQLHALLESALHSQPMSDEWRVTGDEQIRFRQEYGCSFEALEGLVYPDFARCVVPGPAPAGGTLVGGLDFGFRNPFAAIWGTLDRDDVLWLTGEHYARQRPLSYHAQHLPRNVMWYADPSGANERVELRYAGFKVRSGDNAIRPGIAAVSARLENGTLRVVEGACPNLLSEANLYRYSDAADERHDETPVDEHNHALAALRYLIARLDAYKMARPRRAPETPSPSTPEAQSPSSPRPPDPWLRLDNEQLWTRIWPQLEQRSEVRDHKSEKKPSDLLTSDL